MKKQIAVVATIVAIAFSGCGDDRSHPNDGTDVQIVYKNPTAVIDLNSTTHLPSRGGYTVDRTDTGTKNPFIFDGSKSQDNDEDNKSISNYQWSVNHTFISSCVDVNATGNKAVFKFLNVDANETNTTCYDEATGAGEINATLTVTDNEGKTNSITKSIKTN